MGSILESIIKQATQGGGGLGDILGSITGGSPTAEQVDTTKFTEEEKALAVECRQILASTEDVWAKVFKEYNLENQMEGRRGVYTNPTLVLFTNSVSSSCGTASSSVGPFYCSGDQNLYIDLSFFTVL